MSTGETTFFNRKFLWALVMGLPLVIFLLARMDRPASEEAATADMPSPAKAPALVPVQAAPGSARRRNIEIQHWQSGDAVVLFVAASEVPILDVRLVFNAGAARDGQLPGLATLTSGLLSEGTRSQDAQAIATAFESVGASFSASSYRDMAVVQLRTLAAPEFRETALNTLIEILAEPAFATAALEREKKKMFASLQRSQYSPGGIMGQRFYPALYGDHPYGVATGGTMESIPALSREAVQAFHRQFYNRSNVVIVLVGDITRDTANQLAERLTGALPTGEPAPALPDVEGGQTGVVRIPFSSEQTHIQIGMPSLRRDDPDLFPLLVGNEILGGGGLTSLLNQQIREERGLAYSISSYFSPMQVAGPFAIGLQTRSDQADQAIALVYETLDRFMEEGPTDEQLADARTHLAGSFPLQTASNAGIAGYLGAIGFYRLPLDYLDTYVEKVQAVTRSDIMNAFRQHVDRQKMLLVRVGPDPASTAGQP